MRCAGVLGFGLGVMLMVGGCKAELDESKPAADPLEDPWVNGIDTGDDGFADPDAPVVAVAEPGATTDLVAPEATTGPAPAADESDTDTVDIGAPDPDATGPTADSNGGAKAGAKSAHADVAKGGSEPTPGTEGEPAAQTEGDADVPVAEPAPVVEPTPPPEEKPAAPPPITVADFNGSFRFAGGSKQRDDLADAIDDAAMGLPGIIRGIGRKRLTKTNPIDSSLKIIVSNGNVQTIFETGFAAKCVIDGPTIIYQGKKEKFRVRVRQKGNKLIQVIEGTDGAKTTVFVLSADKQKLTVHHKITADKLPDPMTYRLSYARK